MKTTPTAKLVLTSIALLAGFFFHLRTPAPQHPAQAETPKGLPQVKPPVAPVVKTTAAMPDRENLEALKAEQLSRLDAVMKKHAAVMTPQLQELLINHRMKKLEAECAPLFAAWQLDAGTEHETLRLLRERETRVSALRQQALSGGVSHMASGREARLIENALYENELISLLGPSRSAELAALEQQINAQNIARGMELARQAQED